MTRSLSKPRELCNGQPDAQLTYALVKLKTGRTGESLDAFRAVLGSHPRALVAYHAAAYQHMAKKEWGPAAVLLARMVAQIATLQNPRDEYVSHLLQFAGTASGFLGVVDTDSKGNQAIDAAAKKLGPDQQAIYDKARSEFATRYEQTPENQRNSVRRFYRFDFDQVRRYLSDGLN